VPACNINRNISVIVLVFLLLISSVNLFIHTTAAQPDLYIYVYDSYGNSVSRAIVSVYSGNDEIDSGRTNSDGYWITQLDQGRRYRIDAYKGSQSGSWSGTLKSGEISIYMD